MTTELKAPGGASLVINRAKWLRGEGGSNSALLRVTDDKMCCLGFLALSCGMTYEDIRNKAFPSELPARRWPEWLVNENGCTTEIGHELMENNDATELSPEERERRIASVFAKHGVTVTFVDGDASGDARVSEPSKPLETK